MVLRDELPPEIQQKIWDWEHNPAGHVNPVMIEDLGDQMFLIVGGEPILLHKKMNFHEFLVSYSKKIMGEEWGTDELKKPPEEQHPLIRWYREMAERQDSSPDTSEIFGRPARASYGAYLTFAYDLFVLKHHRSLPDTLLARLRHSDQFQGARYELSVAATFIRAGFYIDFDSAFRPSSSHCEFEAKYKKTNKFFSVEAKSRHRKGMLCAPGQREPDDEIRPDIERLVRDALRKSAAYTRIIFVELNLPPDSIDCGMPKWVYDLGKRISSERIRPREECLSAFLIFTNSPFQFVGPDDECPEGVSVLGGINIPAFDTSKGGEPDFGMVQSKFPEIAILFESLRKFSNIPITFQ